MRGPREREERKAPRMEHAFKTAAHSLLTGPLSWGYAIPRSQQQQWARARNAAQRWSQKFWSVNRNNPFRALNTGARHQWHRSRKRPRRRTWAGPLGSWWGVVVTLLGHVIEIVVLWRQPSVPSSDVMVDGGEEERQYERTPATPGSSTSSQPGQHRPEDNTAGNKENARPQDPKRGQGGDGDPGGDAGKGSPGEQRAQKSRRGPCRQIGRAHV